MQHCYACTGVRHQQCCPATSACKVHLQTLVCRRSKPWGHHATLLCMRRCTTPAVLPSHKGLQAWRWRPASVSPRCASATTNGQWCKWPVFVYKQACSAGVKVKAGQCFTKVCLYYNQWAMVQMASRWLQTGTLCNKTNKGNKACWCSLAHSENVDRCLTFISDYSCRKKAWARAEQLTSENGWQTLN